MDSAGLLKQLESDGIENLWIVYHDYGGRACAKTVPQEQFTKAVERGVVFARANLNFTMEDHQAEGATYLAHTGDFLAVPDPESYAVLPHLSATARVHAFMRQDESGILRPEIAMGKAYGALGFGLGSRELRDKNPQFLAAVAAASGGKMVPAPGGVLIRDPATGAIMGAVGISGDVSDNDEAAASAGIEAAGLKADAGADAAT